VICFSSHSSISTTLNCIWQVQVVLRALDCLHARTVEVVNGADEENHPAQWTENTKYFGKLGAKSMRQCAMCSCRLAATDARLRRQEDHLKGRIAPPSTLISRVAIALLRKEYLTSNSQLLSQIMPRDPLIGLVGKPSSGKSTTLNRYDDIL